MIAQKPQPLINLARTVVVAFTIDHLAFFSGLACGIRCFNVISEQHWLVHQYWEYVNETTKRWLLNFNIATRSTFYIAIRHSDAVIFVSLDAALNHIKYLTPVLIRYDYNALNFNKTRIINIVREHYSSIIYL